MSLIGRGLVQDGEAVFGIDVLAGRLALLPVQTYTVTGDPDPSTWEYELTLAGPSTTVTRTVRADRVLHLRYAESATTPWRGVSPVDASGTTRKILSNLETRLAQETGGSVGQVLPVPNVSQTGQLQADLRSLKGEITGPAGPECQPDRTATGRPAFPQGRDNAG